MQAHFKSCSLLEKHRSQQSMLASHVVTILCKCGEWYREAKGTVLNLKLQNQ